MVLFLIGFGVGMFIGVFVVGIGSANQYQKGYMDCAEDYRNKEDN